jgi:ATP-dependent Clp protease ATP-binding subunit ClpC
MRLAREEARGLKHNRIGTEHILLGLLDIEDGLAAQVLNSTLGVTADSVRDRVVVIVGAGEEVSTGQITVTPRSKNVLELALREAMSLGTNAVWPEHILLGLVREGQGVAARILQDLDADADAKIRNAVVRAIEDAKPASVPTASLLPPVTPSLTSGLEQGIHVVPSNSLRRVLRGAAARALEEDRSEIEVTDVLLALTRDEPTARLLAELGVGEAALREAIMRDRAAGEPPEAAAEA